LKKMNETEDMAQVIEKLRSERFPSLPKDLVKHILEIEVEFYEDRGQVFKRIEEIVEQYLDTEEVS